MARALGRTLLATTAIAGLALAPATATAEPTSVKPPERGAKVVHLTVEDGMSQQHRSVWLNCSPAGGTHPKAKAACDALNSTGGKFKSLSANRDALCPLIYRPVTVTAKGTWNGTRVDYTEKFSNACVLHSHTGSVFDFRKTGSKPSA
ncbi:hypothetical protein FHX42_002464 [Saccharopolyspora lacisalsi]|uniref:Subtilisin inhibitor domain-containing protein n=1 Tax=Halosaccharopolyspora lacisalsi TaxID=1000566 RepID=A0A839DVP9_9PSEU|nr:SSI family serine proteinase inhibitor [Halosaccharopolyspora lacisalsi]MBA8825113.1 hypothetical protein [Halosaccharopolyspora lacisalsi]